MTYASFPFAQTRRQELSEWIACSFIGCTGFYILFWPWLGSGFDLVLGSNGDTRIAIAIMEHWYRVFSGVSSDVLSPGFFYPLKGTLGFTDTYFLFALPYAALRSTGFDLFSAFMGTLMLFGVIGFSSFVWLARLALGATPIAAAIGGVAFAFANMVAVKIIHCQIACAMLLPMILCLAITALQTRHRPRSASLGSAAGLSHGLVLLTAFQTGWFFTMALGVFAVSYAALSGWRTTRVQLVQAWSDHRIAICAYVLGFAVGVLPFAIIFGPAIARGEKWPFYAHTHYAPKFLDFINTTSENLVWGPLLAILNLGSRTDGNFHRELELGYPILTFLLWSGLGIALLRHRRRSPSPVSNRDTALLALALMLVVVWLIQLRWFGLWPWRLPYYLVPGASAVRVTVRSQIVVNLGAALLVVAAIDTLRARWQRPLLHAFALVALGGMILAEQVYTDPATFSRRTESRILRVPDPPRTCKAFYVSPSTGGGWIEAQNDAMLLSQIKGIPTINGNTSRFPTGWDMLDPNKPAYSVAVRDWVTRNNIADGICGLDPGTGVWREGLP